MLRGGSYPIATAPGEMVYSRFRCWQQAGVLTRFAIQFFFRADLLIPFGRIATPLWLRDLRMVLYE